MNQSVLCKFLLLVAVALPGIAHAQMKYEGRVLDKSTQTAMPLVTVTIAKARAATQTNNNGYFVLPRTGLDKQDTLVFTCVGYETYQMPVSAYKSPLMVKLTTTNTYLNQVSISHTKRTKTLELFTDRDIYPDDFVTWDDPSFCIYTDDTPFLRMSAFAKLFEAPENGTAILNVQIGRGIDRKLFFYTEPATGTKFKMHVISVNTLTGAPDSIICTKEVSLQDIKRRAVINFNPGEAIVQSAKFFIAIEWLRIPYNEFFEDKTGLQYLEGQKNALLQTGHHRMIYQPLLVGYKKSKKLKNAPSWMKINHQWQRFEHPEYEIALSVTLNY
jgi:hypothetical protein